MIEANMQSNKILTNKSKLSNNGVSKILAVSNINSTTTSKNAGKYSISATNKINQSFSGSSTTNKKFGDRRLSAKVVDTHKKSHIKANSMQYENLML